MSAGAATVRAPAAVRGERSSALTQVGYLARRSVTRTLRHPNMFIPRLVFPLFLLAVNASGLSAATNLPGFPTDSYLSFALGLTFMQGRCSRPWAPASRSPRTSSTVSSTGCS